MDTDDEEEKVAEARKKRLAVQHPKP